MELEVRRFDAPDEAREMALDEPYVSLHLLGSDDYAR